MTFVKKLDLRILRTVVRAQKINSLTFKIFRIVITSFLIFDKTEKSQYFEEIFLLVNISMDIALEILFFTLNNAEINFLD